MSLLDKPDIPEQTAHVGPPKVGTIAPGKLQPEKPAMPYAHVPTVVVPYRHPITYTFHQYPNDTFPIGDVVYFMYSAGRIKIGFSNGVDQRQLTLASAGPFPPVVVLIVRGAVKDERMLHKQFAADRLHGEWFALSKKLRTFLTLRLCDTGRATLDKAEADFVAFCSTIVGAYKPPKRKPRPLCAHGKPVHQSCYPCERERNLKILEELKAGTYRTSRSALGVG